MTPAVADRLDLSDLVHRYAAHVDARRFDDVVALFTPDAELILPTPPERLEPGVRHTGPDRIREALSGLAGITRTQHGIVGEVYAGAAGGDVATGNITAVAHHWIDGDGRITDLIWYLRYTDEYRRTGRGWRIAVRSLTIDAIDTGSARRVRP